MNQWSTSSQDSKTQAASGDRRKRLRGTGRSRRGNVLVAAAAILVLVFSFAAFTVDVGYIALTKTQLQNAADAAALAGGLELPEGYGTGAVLSQSELDAVVRQAAVDVAAVHRAGDVSSVYTDPERDIRLGQLIWSNEQGGWQKVWGQTPVNLIEVTLRRVEGGSGGGDSPLSLFFAPVIGHNTATIEVKSYAALLPGVGFQMKQGSKTNVPILPLALDEISWENLMAGAGEDHFSYDPDTETVSSGSDGILEINLYPYGPGELTPGNRGTVDLGSPNNSTADLKRQILYGLNEFDLSFFGGELRFDDVPLSINGDTGISAGIKDQLAQIIGETRAIPIFDHVSGPGNNATYNVVKFVGVRILDVDLTGSPENKRVIVQPAPLVHPTVIPGKPVQFDETTTLFAPPTLVP